MSRHKKAAPVAAVDNANTHAIAAAMDVVRAAQPELRAQEDLALFELGQQVGAIQMGRLQASVVAAATLRLFEQIKESNKFKDLPLQRPDGRVAAATNLREFCELVFGVGYQRMLEAGQTLEVLGEDAYEAAQRMGLNRKQMRLIRALPSPQQEQIKEAIAGGAREQVVAVIEDLAADLAQTKGEVDELKADKAATQQVLDRKNALIDKLEMKVTSFETAPPDEQYAVLSDKALGVMRSARAQIDGLLRQACMHLKAHGDDRRAHDAFLSGLIAELEHALGALREEFSLPVPDDKALRPWEKEADRVRREQQAARAGKQ